jgi:hypothetical protein
MTYARVAAVVTWVYAAGFGLSTIPVALYLHWRGQLPTFFDLSELSGHVVSACCHRHPRQAVGVVPASRPEELGPLIQGPTRRRPLSEPASSFDGKRAVLTLHAAGSTSNHTAFRPPNESPQRSASVSTRNKPR